MSLRTPDEYRAAIAADGRTLHYRGRKIPDILEEPELRVAVDHAAIDYEVAERPEHRDLTVYTEPSTGQECSAYYRVPRSSADLRARSSLIELCTSMGGTMVTLIKEIGSDGLFA